MLGFELRDIRTSLGRISSWRVRSASACGSCNGCAGSNGSPRRCISADASRKIRDRSMLSSARQSASLPRMTQFCSHPAGLNTLLPASRRVRSSRLEIAAAPFCELVRRGVAMNLGFGSCGAKDLARHLGVSPRQFFRRLKAEGMTCQKIVDDVKFSRARHLLTAGDAPITEIAFALGYPDQSAFTRVFRRWSGVPPSEWRRLSKAG